MGGFSSWSLAGDLVQQTIWVRGARSTARKRAALPIDVDVASGI